MLASRRSFLATCLAVAAAPAIVRAGSLMRVEPLDVSVPVLDFVNGGPRVLSGWYMVSGIDGLGLRIVEQIPMFTVPTLSPATFA